MLQINELIEKDHLRIKDIDAIHKKLSDPSFSFEEIHIPGLQKTLTRTEALENKKQKLLFAFQEYANIIIPQRIFWDGQQRSSNKYPFEPTEINNYYQRIIANDPNDSNLLLDDLSKLKGWRNWLPFLRPFFRAKKIAVLWKECVEKAFAEEGVGHLEQIQKFFQGSGFYNEKRHTSLQFGEKALEILKGCAQNLEKAKQEFGLANHQPVSTILLSNNRIATNEILKEAEKAVSDSKLMLNKIGRIRGLINSFLATQPRAARPVSVLYSPRTPRNSVQLPQASSSSSSPQLSNSQPMDQSTLAAAAPSISDLVENPEQPAPKNDRRSNPDSRRIVAIPECPFKDTTISTSPSPNLAEPTPVQVETEQPLKKKNKKKKQKHDNNNEEKKSRATVVEIGPPAQPNSAKKSTTPTQYFRGLDASGSAIPLVEMGSSRTSDPSSSNILEEAEAPSESTLSVEKILATQCANISKIISDNINASSKTELKLDSELLEKILIQLEEEIKNFKKTSDSLSLLGRELNPLSKSQRKLLKLIKPLASIADAEGKIAKKTDKVLKAIANIYLEDNTLSVHELLTAQIFNISKIASDNINASPSKTELKLGGKLLEEIITQLEKTLKDFKQTSNIFSSELDKLPENQKKLYKLIEPLVSAANEEGKIVKNMDKALKAIVNIYLEDNAQSVHELLIAQNFNILKLISENINASPKAELKPGSEFLKKIITSLEEALKDFKHISSIFSSELNELPANQIKLCELINPLASAADGEGKIAKETDEILKAILNIYLQYDDETSISSQKQCAVLLGKKITFILENIDLFDKLLKINESKAKELYGTIGDRFKVYLKKAPIIEEVVTEEDEKYTIEAEGFLAEKNINSNAQNDQASSTNNNSTFTNVTLALTTNNAAAVNDANKAPEPVNQQPATTKSGLFGWGKWPFSKKAKEPQSNQSKEQENNILNPRDEIDVFAHRIFDSKLCIDENANRIAPDLDALNKAESGIPQLIQECRNKIKNFILPDITAEPDEYFKAGLALLMSESNGVIDTERFAKLTEGISILQPSAPQQPSL